VLSKSVQRVVVHAMALCTALIGVYSLLGFIALPYWIQHKLLEFREPLGANVSVADLAINPFLLTATIRGLTVSKDSDPPILHTREVLLDLSVASVVKRTWIIDSLLIRSPQINIVRDADGRMNVAALSPQSTPSVSSTADAAAPPETSSPIPVVLQSISVDDGSVRYLDRMHSEPVQIVVGPIVVRAERLGTVRNEPGSFELRTALPNNGSARAKGSLSLLPFISDGIISAVGIRVAELAALAMTAGAIDPPEGQLDLAVRYRFATDKDGATVALHGLTAALTNLSLRRAGSKHPMVELPGISFSGGAIDFDERKVALQIVEVRGGQIDGHVNPEGELDLAAITEAFSSLGRDPPTSSRPWEVAIAAFRLEAIALAYTYADGAVGQDLKIGNSTLLFSARGTLGPERLDAQMRDIQLTLQDVRIGDEDEDPKLRLATVQLQGGTIDTQKRRIGARSLDISDGRLSIARTTGGVVGLASGESPVVRTSPDAESSRQPWQIVAETFRLQRMELRYDDRDSPVPIALGVARAEAAMRIALTVDTDLVRASATDIRLGLAKVELSDVDAREPAVLLTSVQLDGGQLDTASRTLLASSIQFDGLRADMLRDHAGTIGLPRAADVRRGHPRTTGNSRRDVESAPRRGAWRVHIDHIAGSLDSVRFRDHASTPPFTASAGPAKLGFALEMDVGEKVRVVVGGLDARVHGLSLQTPESAATAQLSHVAIENGRLDTADGRFVAQSILLADGRLPIVRTDRGGTELAGIPLGGGAASEPDAQAKRGGLLYDVAKLRIENVGVAIADHGFAPAVNHEFVLDGSAHDLRRGHSQPLKVDVTARLAQGGSIHAEGSLAQSFSAGTVRLHAEEIALAPLSAYLTKYTYLELATGTAAGDAKLRFGDTPDRPRVLFEGAMHFADVLVNEIRTGKAFVAWKTLDVREIAIGLGPNRIDIAEVAVLAPQAELIVSEDRSLNLHTLLRKQRAGSGERWQDNFPIRVGRISIAQGELQFADLSLVLPFSTRVQALEGAVVGLSSSPNARAELELTGQIADHGSASARGGLNAFDPSRFTDIRAKFDNVLIPPFSPYTATFAGRTIESGRLWLDLEYRIVEGQLSGQNKASIHNLELGERVEAPNAADLPLELAVALLQDDEGRINLQIPVSGNMGDPKFDYGAIIGDAIGATVRRIVGAPFRALASLFGGDDSEDVRTVEFRPGDHQLTPAERQQLAQVTKALQSRPALRLLIQGPYAPRRDAQALREQVMRRAVWAPADPIALTDPPTQAVLEKMLLERLPEADYVAFKRISGPSDAHYYEGILAELVARIDIDEGRLRLLAANRARAIADALTESGISPDRIEASGIRSVDEDSQAIPATLDLDVLPTP